MDPEGAAPIELRAPVARFTYLAMALRAMALRAMALRAMALREMALGEVDPDLG